MSRSPSVRPYVLGIVFVVLLAVVIDWGPSTIAGELDTMIISAFHALTGH